MRKSIFQPPYPDPQTQPASGFCPVCGGEVYAPSLACSRCERGRIR